MTASSVEEPRPTAFSGVDQIVDDLLPEELDWKGAVRSYPLVAVGVAAAGGFLIGWSQGPKIVAALSELATERVNETVDRYVDFGRSRGRRV